jgi:large subunit ribosomal protein L19
MKRIAQLESQYKKKVPPFRSGDTVRVHYRIKEGDKERIQVFQGTVISRRGSGVGATFTVRKISSGIGVERVFPLHSPNIARIEKTMAGDVKRAKLYYLRSLTGKSARIKRKLEGTGTAENGGTETEQATSGKVREAEAAKSEEVADAEQPEGEKAEKS